MNKTASCSRLYILLFLSALIIGVGCQQMAGKKQSQNKLERYDGPALIAEQEYRHTKDPVLAQVPRKRLAIALQQTMDSRINYSEAISAYGVWTERGPVSDAVGSSNGNTRPNSGITSGRVRAVLVDAADPSGNTVWVGGVAGGLWKTTDITASPATWTVVNDFLSNMAVTSICQNPADPNIMYFCTGEPFYNVDAVAGDGVFKSTDNGATWTQLSSTTGASFDYCSKIVCDASGNVYVTSRNGVFRSTTAGSSWTTITPSGLSTSRFSDMEISSTGRLHVSAGIWSTCAYRYTDNPSTVTSAGWSSASTGFPSSTIRIELVCSGNTLYALPSDASYEVPALYKSTDGGANWSATSSNPTAGWAGGQAWYNLAGAIDPSNSNTAIVGGLEPYKTTDGGATWTKLANWVGTTGQYVHADIHFIQIYGTNRVLFGCDGGIHYSADGGTTIRDKNTGLRIKQFFSCAIHPATTNYFLAGAQDNGSHQFSSAGLGATVEVTGGDGAFVHIDQNEPQYQFTSYIYNRYRRSTNSGATWSAVDLSLSAIGQFINPTDYDDVANIMYCANLPGTYRRWTNPQTGNTSATVSITALNSNTITAVKVSPVTSNRVYFGTEDDFAAAKVCYVDNANTTASGSAGVDISTGLPTTATVSCIDVGTTDNNLLCSFSNYGINNVWVSTNGGSAWTAIDGNLPDMPVRWCMFVPGNNNAAILATEAGVWFTNSINGASTVWMSSPTFPAVRTDMLQYRSSDKLIVAATHGRGLWTQNIFSILPANNFNLRGKWTNNQATELSWSFANAITGGKFSIEFSYNGQAFKSSGVQLDAASGKTDYGAVHYVSRASIYYRVKYTGAGGNVLYSNVVKLTAADIGAGLAITGIYPNPVQSELKVGFYTSERGTIAYSISTINGQTVWRNEESIRTAGNYNKALNVQNLKPGLYILSVSNGSKMVSQKFIRQ